MTPDKTLTTVAILMPGDMGHGCASQFRQHGLRVVTCLAGRSQRTKSLADKAGLENFSSLGDLVQSVDLILSILPPEHALSQAQDVATAMRATGAYPDYVDCNAISPTTTKQVAASFDGLPARFIDGGIIGLNPVKENGRTRLYVSGQGTSLVRQLDGRGIIVRDLGDEIGRASAMKMIYASSTKGAFTLFAAVAVMAELAGLRDEIFHELEQSQPTTMATIKRMMPRIPLDAKRWIFEMEEIARTYDTLGMTPHFHQGAAAMMQLADQTPLARGTRETAQDDTALADVLQMYVDALRAKPLGQNY
ncbi:MAG: NAD(P)-dependent oxidoreductase [Candidatus Puniceispirillum sp.]|nr:NAD(P)-dependent oxidoreductase [Candidatus Puniceispirillum sp.]